MIFDDSSGASDLRSFDTVLASHQRELRHTRTEVLQINVGKLCNLTCMHCHVNAGPKRKEIMRRETVDRIMDWFARTDIPRLDLTGGAPEMIPDFRHLVQRARALAPRRHIMDRCNLTILLEPGFEGLAEFLAENEVEVVASMPCYSAKNVEEQRGEGTFDASIKALQHLNALGYGTDPRLPLNLVYNPNGAFLPGPQAELEEDYKVELDRAFGIVFNHLYAFTNLPIARFRSYLKNNGKLAEYMSLLIENFNPSTVDGLMCRNTLSIDWEGRVYDCDFNQMLNMKWTRPDDGGDVFIWDLDPASVEHRVVPTGPHCFGCTAGAGSSCGGTVL